MMRQVARRIPTSRSATMLAELCKTYLSHFGLTTDDDIFQSRLEPTRRTLEVQSSAHDRSEGKCSYVHACSGVKSTH